MINHLFWWFLRRINCVSKKLIPNKNDKLFLLVGLRREHRVSTMHGKKNE